MAIDQAKLDQLIGRIRDGLRCRHARVDRRDRRQARASTRRSPTTAGHRRRRSPSDGYDARLVEEWLNAQFVTGYCDYDPSDGTFWLTDEQAAVLADTRRRPSSPAR